MKKSLQILFILLFIVGINSSVYAADSSYGTAVYRAQGGDELVVASGGKITVASGGEVDYESGSSFEIGGVAITASAAELNFNDGATAGNQVANKTVVADANINTGVSKVTELHIGTSGSETQVTATGTELNLNDGQTATAAEVNNACDVSARVQAMTASGNVTAGVQSVELDHTSVTIAAVMADATNHEGFFHVKATTEPGGGGDHTLTMTSGTFNGSNTVATFADIQDALVIYIDSAGNGSIVVNVGSVALSGP